MDKFVMINGKVFNTRTLKVSRIEGGQIVKEDRSGYKDAWAFNVWDKDTSTTVTSKTFDLEDEALLAQLNLIKFLNRAMATPTIETPRVEI